MVLEGQIKVFGVADIIQLISQQQKTGVLCVQKELGVKAEITFLKGNITGAKPTEYKTCCPLGEMLVAAKMLSPEDQKKALVEQEKTFEYLGQILVREGMVTPEVVKRALVTQIYETAYDVLQWNEGTYFFEQKDIILDSNLPNPVPVESMLLDVLRMVDEWPDLEKEFKHLDVIYQPVPGGSEEDLDSDEAVVYRLVDGKKTMQEIIYQGLLGRFLTVKALIELNRRGYVEIIKTETPSVKKRAAFNFVTLIKPFSYAAVVLLLASAFVYFVSSPNNLLTLITSGLLKQSVANSYLKNQNVSRVKKALEMYRMKEGAYPEDLSSLVSDGFLRDEDLAPRDNVYLQYDRLDKRYQLMITRVSE